MIQGKPLRRRKAKLGMRRRLTVWGAATLGLLLWRIPLPAQVNVYMGPPGRSPQYYQQDPFYQFANQYPGTADQLRNDPSLLSNRQYMKQHPEVFSFLNSNPAFAQQLQRDPYMLQRGPYSNKYWNPYYKKHRKHHQHYKDYDYNWHKSNGGY
jgi:hypothetical protein